MKLAMMLCEGWDRDDWGDEGDATSPEYLMTYGDENTLVTWLLGSDGQLYYEPGIVFHDEIAASNGIESGEELMTGRNGVAPLPDGEDGHIVTIWGVSQDVLDTHLVPCLQQLVELGLATPDSVIYSVAHDGERLGDIASSGAKAQIDPERERKLELARKMHLLRGAEKMAAMKELGVGGGGTQHPMAKSMQQHGLLGPGQKWWASNSESFSIRLNNILEANTLSPEMAQRNNDIMFDIAQGVSYGRIAKTYGVLPPYTARLKKRMVQAGWKPGQPPPESLKWTHTPAAGPKPPKYPGMTPSERNTAVWADPEQRAKFVASRQDPEYRAAQSERIKQVHQANPQLAAHNREFMLQKMQNDPEHRRKAATALYYKERNK